MILRLLVENPDLHYFQGLHDVVLTFLPVTGEELAYAIMNILVKCHIRYAYVPYVTTMSMMCMGTMVFHT